MYMLGFHSLPNMVGVTQTKRINCNFLYKFHRFKFTNDTYSTISKIIIPRQPKVLFCGRSEADFYHMIKLDSSGKGELPVEGAITPSQIGRTFLFGGNSDFLPDFNKCKFP